MQVSVVTSFSAAGFAKYGRRCIETLHEFWPQNVSLYIVSEDDIEAPKLEGRQVHFLNLCESSSWAKDFYSRHEHNSIAHGRGPKASSPKHNRHWKTGYNFRLDAYKFSKKVFAIEAVARRVSGGKLIWLDADTVTHQPVPSELLDRMPPSDYSIAYLNRGYYHSECGFVSYDLNKPETREFITQFAALYHSGVVFNLKEWHDSWVFDWLRKKLGIRAWPIPHQHYGQPFDHSELGRYMSHLKGDLKNKATV